MPRYIKLTPQHERAVMARLRLLRRAQGRVEKALVDVRRVKPEWTPRLAVEIEVGNAVTNLEHALDNFRRIVRYVE